MRRALPCAVLVNVFTLDKADEQTFLQAWQRMDQSHSLRSPFQVALRMSLPAEPLCLPYYSVCELRGNVLIIVL
jgi:hypothetical protein